MNYTKTSHVPEGFLPHNNDRSRFGYPPGVEHSTLVSVIISRNGNMTIWHNEQASQFGWMIQPHNSMCPAAPITHYKIEQA